MTQNEDDNSENKPSSLLTRLFVSCADDPKGSVHRAWGVSLIFLILYFVLAILEMLNLQSRSGSRALVFGTIWSGAWHLILAVLGTFVLKRFPTSFALGFLLGILVVCCNQNFILFGIFHTYPYGNVKTNHIFSSACFLLAVFLLFFTALLVHFRDALVVAPIDVKGMRDQTSALGNTNKGSDDGDLVSTDYQSH